MKVSEYIGTIISCLLIMAVVVLVFMVVCGECGTLTTYHFVAPGLGGMVSNYDAEMLEPIDALYLLNADVTTTPGMIKRRTAISDYGVNVTLLYGASGYYNPLTGDKLVIGVTDNAVDGLGQFIVSDTFGTEVGYDTLGGTMFPYADVYHDFTPYGDIMVCTDGKQIPCLFSTSQGFLYTQSKPDTFGYEPHFISMGLEAPGQPRIGIVDDVDGQLTGRYIYAFAYFYDSVIGIESRPITVEDQRIYITNFPKDTTVSLLRKTGQEDNLWYLLDTMTVTTDGYYHIDSLSDTARFIWVEWYRSDSVFYDTLPSTDLGYYYDDFGNTYYQCCNEPESWDSVGYRVIFWDSVGGPNPYSLCCGPDCWIKWGCGIGRTWGRDSIVTDVDSFSVDTVYADTTIEVYEPQSSGRAPGQFVYLDQAGKIDTVGYVASLPMASPDSLYWIAYSYYDQITGIESPLGPILACSLTVIDTDSVFSRLFGFDNFDLTLNPANVRVYQTVAKTTLPGASDTMVWYGVLEMRAFDGSVVLGNWNDDSVAVGLDTGYINTNLYYTYQMLRNDFGGVKIQPPYSYDCRIPFSDIEYMAGQFWGIGDPDYPNRIYFSEYDWPGMNIFSWYPLDFVQIQEIGSDEFVKIERAEGFGADALYVLAHNSVWLLNTSGDYQAISTRVGAASIETVVKYGESIYFLSPTGRFYVLIGGQLSEISQPVENYVDTVFEGFDVFGYQGFRAAGHTFGDYVRWFNDSTGMGMSFNTKSGTWTLERYGSGKYIPRGSFVYDTLYSADIAMTYDLELLYSDSTVSLRRMHTIQTVDAGDINNEKTIDFAYQTPLMGTGNHFWQIQEFDMNIEAIGLAKGGAIHYIVYGEYGDSLCADSIFYSPAESNSTLNYRIHPPYNTDHRVSLKIYSNDTLFTNVEHIYNLLDVTVKLRDMGAGNVQ